MKKNIIVCLAIGSCLLLFSFTSPTERLFEIAKNLEIFSALFKEVNAEYVDDTNPNRLVRNGIDAMLNSLDPYTNYIPEDEVENYRTLTTGQYGGIGASTINLGKRVVVNMVFEDYPAFKNGLKIGDEIVKINGIELSKLSEEEATRLMKGQVGTSVKTSVRRVGHDGLIDLEFKREKIKTNSVPFSGMIPNTDVGFVQLTEFTSECGKELKKRILSLKEQNAKKLILDLRGNPGGHLEEAIDICNFFIPKEKLVVATKGKNEQRSYNTQNNPLDETMPVVVLINRGSASASEIVAGTLQDYDRAVVMGERSYGKGLVQMSKPFIYNSYLKMTTAKYYIPSGRCIQALDYTHRRADGSVASVPDSLKKEFKTSQGRKVFDGGGIEPDVIFVKKPSSDFITALTRQGFIFDYATQYVAAHGSIAAPKLFSLKPDEYQAFVNWMKDKPLHYQTKVESGLKNLEEEAKQEHLDFQPQIDKIKKSLAKMHQEDYITYKDQVLPALEQEIISHYYYDRGAAEYSVSHDPEIVRAVDILNNATEYKKILLQPY